MEDKIKQVEDISTTETTQVEQSTKNPVDVELFTDNAEEPVADSDTAEIEGATPKKNSGKKKEKTTIVKVDATQKDSHTVKCEQLAKEYSKSYPDQSEIHITSDYQVFLSENKSHALNHQRTQKSGELVTIKIK